MRNIMLTIMCLGMLAMVFTGLTGSAFAESFVHPLDFDGTDAEKSQVIAYIKADVKETYSKIGMNNPTTLRMMEQENLNAFKQLTKTTNRPLLDKVIKTYCGVGMCNYNTILMMYKEELQASKQTLEW